MTVLRKRLTRSQRKNFQGYLFISPWIIGMLLFTLYPIGFSIVISFTEWSLVGNSAFIGLDNYRRMFTDPLFFRSLGITGRYVLMTLPASLAISLLIAVLLNANIRFRGTFRVFFYLPAVLPTVAVSLVWAFIFSKDYGLLNNTLRMIGIRGPNWLGDTKTALPAVAMMSIWSGCAGTIIMYLAGLQGVPRTLYEAAEIDGAGAFSRFFRITLPMMTPILFYTLITGIINSFQVFSQAMILTKGGPARATTFYVLYLYNTAFSYFELGYASALAWALFLIILALSVLVFSTSRGWVHYEGGD